MFRLNIPFPNLAFGVDYSDFSIGWMETRRIRGSLYVEITSNAPRLDGIKLEVSDSTFEWTRESFNFAEWFSIRISQEMRLI